jgi:hypothetical protein
MKRTVGFVLVRVVLGIILGVVAPVVLSQQTGKDAIFLFPVSAVIAGAQTTASANNSEAVDFLIQLIKINTSNPPGNETLAAQYIKSVLDKKGIASEIFESAPGAATLSRGSRAVARSVP